MHKPSQSKTACAYIVWAVRSDLHWPLASVNRSNAHTKPKTNTGVIRRELYVRSRLLDLARVTVPKYRDNQTNPGYTLRNSQKSTSQTYGWALTKLHTTTHRHNVRKSLSHFVSDRMNRSCKNLPPLWPCLQGDQHHLVLLPRGNFILF